MRLPLIFGCAALSGLLLSAQVFAQDSIPLFGDKTPDIVNPARSVSQLINRGKYADAMNLADKELAANPQNVNLRFLRGVIFMETKKNDEAKKVFEQLIREYPEIADSYNNLAVIYAGEGNLGRAQDQTIAGAGFVGVLHLRLQGAAAEVGDDRNIFLPQGVGKD